MGFGVLYQRHGGSCCPPEWSHEPQRLFLELIYGYSLERDRKAEHIELALKPDVQSTFSYFDKYVFEHEALPELDFEEIDTRSSFLGKQIGAPILISSMTGGTSSARDINLHLAQASEARKIPFALGSQRKAIEDRSQISTFEVRHVAPSIPILANLGAVQLNYGFGLSECEEAVQMVGADALIFHLNPLQEVLQPEGQTNFANLIPQLGEVAKQLSVPVIIKEIGCGISKKIASKLKKRGITIIDVAGSGGTSWARIETHRSGNYNLGDLYADWGIPTPLSIKLVQSVPGLTVIGSGGIRSGLDIAKSIALGADLAGLASPFLGAAMESTEAVIDVIDRLVYELKIAMFCTGSHTIAELQRAPLHHLSDRL